MTMDLRVTIVGQDVPCDIYRQFYIKQHWQFLCCEQYLCNMMSWVRERSLECAVNNSINNTQPRLAPQRRESVMEISSRGKTRARKWGQGKDARSLDCAGRGVAFQGRERFGHVLKWQGCCCGRSFSHQASLSSATCFVSVLWTQEWMADSQCHMPADILKEGWGKWDCADTGILTGFNRGPIVWKTVMEASVMKDNASNYCGFIHSVYEQVQQLIIKVIIVKENEWNN